MTEYSVEEVRAQAQLARGFSEHWQRCLQEEMLNDYADLLEQIERARERVTDEVLFEAVRVFSRTYGAGHRPRRVGNTFDAMRAALQSVAHLLPSERGGVAPVPCSLNEALNVIEHWGRRGNTLKGDDVDRFRALADRIAPAQAVQS